MSNPRALSPLPFVRQEGKNKAKLRVKYNRQEGEGKQNLPKDSSTVNETVHRRSCPFQMLGFGLACRSPSNVG